MLEAGSHQHVSWFEALPFVLVPERTRDFLLNSP